MAILLNLGRHIKLVFVLARRVYKKSAARNVARTCLVFIFLGSFPECSSPSAILQEYFVPYDYVWDATDEVARVRRRRIGKSTTKLGARVAEYRQQLHNARQCRV
eukprot:scaffold62550_cov15-Prasinocladus_malaysianus.AAC.1